MSDIMAQGAPYAEMEVMKMLFMLTAPEAGVATLIKPANTFVETGEMIARLELDDASLVAKVCDRAVSARVITRHESARVRRAAV